MAALLILALAVLICGFTLVSPILTTGISASAQAQSSETLTQLIQRLSTEGMTELTSLTTNYSPREFGTGEELAAAEFIEQKMKKLDGYTVTVQSFTPDVSAKLRSDLSLTSPTARNLRSRVLTGSATGDVTAPIVSVGKARTTDIPESGLTDKIALIERGGDTFAEKVKRVADAGAVGAIIYNNVDKPFKNGVFHGTLVTANSTGSSIPATAIWRDEGTTILATLNGGTEVRAKLVVASEKQSSRNIIVEKAGSDSNAGVVVVGAHYDTVANTQGANDNGTGVASLFVMADEIANRQFAHTVRFIFFGSEENGLHGSWHYVTNLSASDRSKIIAMLNFDVLGSGNPTVETFGSTLLTNWVTRTYAPQNSLNVRSGRSGCYSDHCYFIRNLNVPSIMFIGDDLSVVNSSADVIDLIDPSIMGTHMAIALEMIKQAPDIVAQPTHTPTPTPTHIPTPTHTPTLNDELLERYDADESGSIEIDEAVQAVNDYADGILTIEEVVIVVRLYASG